MARSFSEIVAEQLCLGNRQNGHAFPWFLPFSYAKIAKSYYKLMKPKLVLALDVTYHPMKFLEDTAAKKKELENLVAGLALDCESDLYDCSAKGNESYVVTDNYKPTVLLGDIFFEKLIDCDQSKPKKVYTIENSKNHRNKELCFDEYSELNRYLRELAANYPNVHILPANRLFTALQNYPNSIFYDEGVRQTFFYKKELTWDGWHPWTDPGSYVFANLTILEINGLIAAGKIKGRPIPLKEISGEYFGPPSGLIILAPAGFPPTSRPQITAPDGSHIPLRFSLAEEWAARHGVFSIGTSYLRDRALSWDRLGPKPLVLHAQSFAGTALVLSEKDRDILISHYHNGLAFKGALLLIGADLSEDIVSKEDTLFLQRFEKDKAKLKKNGPSPVPDAASPWVYSSVTAPSRIHR
jgi:hypothetical protein